MSLGKLIDEYQKEIAPEARARQEEDPAKLVAREITLHEATSLEVEKWWIKSCEKFYSEKGRQLYKPLQVIASNGNSFDHSPIEVDMINFIRTNQQLKPVNMMQVMIFVPPISRRNK